MTASNDAGMEESWEGRIAAAWAGLETLDPEAFIATVRALAAERPARDAAALFELASACDSTGREAEAAPLYQQALSYGLQGLRRRRATIQLASTLRNLGQSEQSVALLEAEMDQPSDELDDAVAAFLALACADLGQERRGLSLALGALATHLPRYNRSLGRYAQALIE
jgi:tetratricopeptide (TPR) repeat protein